MEIERYLLDKGIKPNLKGFEYLTYAIEMCQKDKTYFNGLTTRLYPDIATDLNTLQGRVERAMRHAVKNAGHSQTLAEFIARAVLDLRLNKSVKRKARS